MSGIDNEIVGRIGIKEVHSNYARVFELEIGWRFRYMGSQYEVVSVGETIRSYRVMPDNEHLLTGWVLEFGRGSQKKVELVWIIRQSAMNKINQHEYVSHNQQPIKDKAV